MSGVLRLAAIALLSSVGLGALHAEPAPAPRVLSLGKRVADPGLAARRAGTDTHSDASLQASVSGNQAVNVTTGSNAITGGALAGAAGIPVVVQNTGNNVLIQTSVIVNLQLK